MDSFNFKLLLQDKINQSTVGNLSDENMSLLIKKSIVRLFGELYLGKFYFKVKAVNLEQNLYNISFISEYKKKLMTALLLISDLEYNVRIIICK